MRAAAVSLRCHRSDTEAWRPTPITDTNNAGAGVHMRTRPLCIRRRNRIRESGGVIANPAALS